MNTFELIFAMLGIVGSLLCVANIVYSVIRFRNRNVESYIQEREKRKLNYQNGKFGKK